MSLTEIRNVVLLFSNPVWQGTSAPDTVIRNITALSSQLAYEDTIKTNLTTLTTNNAETLNGVIQGLLYVPTITHRHPCRDLELQYLPANVTRQANLPPVNYKLIALAPWFNNTCTQEYLDAARNDPVRGFIFYRPNNSSTKPQDVESPVWDLDDGGLWKKENHFPIFAASGATGQDMMAELGRYSKSVAEVPHGSAIMELYGPNPRDYVRIWTELSLKNPSDLPAMWTYLIIVIGALCFVVITVSLMMHLINRGRRQSLRRRVESGEVDLEAMGIKRLTVPTKHIDEFPLFTYLDAGKHEEHRRAHEAAATGTPPQSPVTSHVENQTSRSVRSLRRKSRAVAVSNPVSDTDTAAAGTPLPRKRSNLIRSKSTMATNYQPHCHICLEAFVEHVTIIRQLPCGHIFHHECIDEFLSLNSSLCPICKQCMLPLGFSPKITNGMVRRERAMRQLRSRVHLDEEKVDERWSGSGGYGIVGASGGGSGSGSGIWFKRLLLVISPRGHGEIHLTPISQRSPALKQGQGQDTVAGLDPPQSTQTPGLTGETETCRRSRRERNQPRLGQVAEHPDVGITATVQAWTGPSDLARRRMQDLAEHFDDPDQAPTWKRTLSRIFHSFS